VAATVMLAVSKSLWSSSHPTSPVLVLVVILAEVSMLIYLLAKGVKTTAPESVAQVAQPVS